MDHVMNGTERATVWVVGLVALCVITIAICITVSDLYYPPCPEAEEPVQAEVESMEYPLP